MKELFERAQSYGKKTAIVDPTGTFSYSDLVGAARSVAGELTGETQSLDGARVATMIEPSFAYVAVQWGVWLAGGIAVPLALTHPEAEIEYLLEDADVSIAVTSEEYRARVTKTMALRGGTALAAGELLAVSPKRAEQEWQQNAMLLYTSGTTGRSKGVVWRHDAIRCQAEVMSAAWQWQPADRALLVLPLHHVHGLINVVTTGLWNGATVEMHGRFDVDETWQRLRSGDLSVFMAVPTIYRRLLSTWDGFDDETRRDIRRAMSGMRLMVSGSAALPVATLEAWREASGHVLLERYGMTEIGMALSNSYAGQRIAGTVGRPLPTVETRVVDDSDEVVPEGTQGRLQVRGPSVFCEYWRRPAVTEESFVDGWFRTGDVVRVDDGVFRILGRESVDIIKTGAEKVSALEIEDGLREHSAVSDCAVVGLPDPDWGEVVAVALIPAAGTEPPNLKELRDWCRDKLAPEKLPRKLLVVEELPRNALGKVVKPLVKELFG